MVVFTGKDIAHPGCDKQKSYAEGDTFYSCGSGSGKTEEEACKEALKSAHDEFTYICENSFLQRKRKIVKPGKIKVIEKRTNLNV